MKKLVLAGVLGSLFAAPSFAADNENGGHFNRVEARYVSFDDYDPDVYGLSGRSSFSDDFYVTADYFRHSYDGASLNQAIVGVGYKHQFSGAVTGFVDGNLGYADGSGGYDESGYAVQTGLVYSLNDSFELSALLRHIDFDTDTQEYEIGARVYLGDSFSVNATYIDGFDDMAMSGYFIGAAYHF